MDDEFYRLLNLIRFGPDVSNIYEERINHRVFADKIILLICQCASLTNKMDLVSKLLPDFYGVSQIAHICKVHYLKLF